MKFEVHQFRNEGFAMVHGLLGTGPKYPEAFRLVAYVEAQSLEEVMQLTNSIDDLWVLNKGVTLAEGIEAGLRSTSPGDVVVDEMGVAHRCMAFGWQPMQIEETA